MLQAACKAQPENKMARTAKEQARRLVQECRRQIKSGLSPESPYVGSEHYQNRLLDALQCLAEIDPAAYNGLHQQAIQYHLLGYIL